MSPLDLPEFLLRDGMTQDGSWSPRNQRCGARSQPDLQGSEGGLGIEVSHVENDSISQACVMKPK